MVKVKLEGMGPLSYFSVDDAGPGEFTKLEYGEVETVVFEKQLQVFGSPINPARCNLLIYADERGPCSHDERLKDRLLIGVKKAGGGMDIKPSSYVLCASCGHIERRPLEE